MEKYSIFLSVGTQLPFDRLVKFAEEVFVKRDDVYPTWQVGNGGYKPSEGMVYETMDRSLYTKVLEESDLLITHCGIGNIVTATSRGVSVICCPRMTHYGEHRNDHQLDTAEAISQSIVIVNNAEELQKALDEKIKEIHSGPSRAVVNPINKNFMKSLERIVESL